MSHGCSSCTNGDPIPFGADFFAETEGADGESVSFTQVLQLLSSVREICEQILVNCATLDAETAQRKNECLMQQLEELNEAAKKMAEANKGSLIGRIFGFISLVISAVLVCLCPTPMTVAGFCVCLGMTIDSEVAAHLENYDGMMGTLTQELMEAMDGLPPALAAVITAVVIIAIMVAITVVCARGLGMAFPNMTGAPPQFLLNLIGPQNVGNMNTAVEATKILTQCVEMAMQIFSAVANFQAAGFIRNSEDLQAVIEFLEMSLTFFSENSEEFNLITDTLDQLYAMRA